MTPLESLELTVRRKISEAFPGAACDYPPMSSTKTIFSPDPVKSKDGVDVWACPITLYFPLNYRIPEGQSHDPS